MPLTLIILVGLFVMQSRGTAKIGRLFGPVMVVWFVVLAVLGTHLDHARAADPARASIPGTALRCSCTSRGPRSSRSAPSCWR